MGSIGPTQIILVLLCMTAIFIMLAALWKIFEKAGQPGWAAIVPIYNYYIWTKIIGKPGYWTLLMLIPYVNIIFLIWAMNLISKSFGKDEAYTVGMILLPFVFYPLLGFGDANYQGPAAAQTT